MLERPALTAITSFDTTAGRARDTALTALAPISWGTTYLVTTELLPPGAPMASAVLRAAPAGLLCLAAAALGRRRSPAGGAPGGRTTLWVPRGWWRRLVVLAVLNVGAFFPLLFVAAYRLPGGEAAVVGALQPLIIAALSAGLGWGRTRIGQLAWMLAAAIGVALTTLSGPGRLDGLGLGAALAGTAAMGLGVALTRRWGTPPGCAPLAVTGWQLLIGGAAIAPLIPLLDTGPVTLDPPAIAGYAWLALVGGAAAYALWFRGARRLPATNTSLLGVLSPLTAALLGWLVLGQRLTGWQAAGYALALAGSLLGQRAPRRHHPASPPAPTRPRCAES